MSVWSFPLYYIFEGLSDRNEAPQLVEPCFGELDKQIYFMF